jgi:hypothetical protein
MSLCAISDDSLQSDNKDLTDGDLTEPILDSAKLFEISTADIFVNRSILNPKIVRPIMLILEMLSLWPV